MSRSMDLGMDEEILREFVTESLESLDEIEPQVVGLSSDHNSTDSLHAVFRTMHSIKGTASFCGLSDITKVAHSAENLLDGLRHETLDATSDRVDLLCSVVDFLRAALSTLASGRGEETYATQAASLTARLDESLKPNEETVAQQHVLQPVQSPRADVAPSTTGPTDNDIFTTMPDLVERFIIESEEQLVAVEAVLLEIEQSGSNATDISEAFRYMHSFKGNCGIMSLPHLEQLTHALENQLSDWSKQGLQPQSEQVTLMLASIDLLRRAIGHLHTERGHVEGLGGLLHTLEVARTRRGVTPSMQKNLDQAVAVMGAVETRGTANNDPGSAENHGERTSSTIRVDTKKLDELMNLVGELIIAETTVTHNPDIEGRELENFQKAALNLNRITRLLQDVTTQVRMVPIEGAFRKMVRLVRDLAQKQGKKVELITSGEETEVDKSVVETIADPLVHLIRNAIDHGLEAPDARTRAGKSVHGTIRLEATHQGGEVWIKISDDGRGIDPEKILARAVERGVADAQRNYSRTEILHFIFAPGFSTAEVLTDISGRGVGMDVVKRNVERVNGRVEIETTLGKGTSFVLRIPLTLAIIEGMLVRVGTAHYTIPLLSIRESVRATKSNLTTTSDGQQLLRLRDRHFPILVLNELGKAGHQQREVAQGTLVLIESASRVACLLVDEVIGQRQTVIKPLPSYLRSVENLSGCSILHNGDISLIVDVEALVRSVSALDAA